MAEIILDKINYTYSDGTAYEIQALKDVNLQIHQGEFIGIIGHTGSGKSTLTQLLNGLLRASSGSIYVDGQDIYDEGYDMKALRSKVGLVFQYPEHQLFEVDVFSDVCFGPKNLGLPKEEIEKRAKEALDMGGLDESFYKQSPFDLSGGQKQRVAIAGVVAMEPKCIVLDEPTAMLDPNGRADVIRTAHELNQKKGVTIILITHYMEEVVGADKVIVMDKGKVVMQGTPREIFSQVGKLKEYRLDVPQVTILADLLRQSGLDIPLGVLTREELVGHILRIAQIDS